MLTGLCQSTNYRWRSSTIAGDHHLSPISLKKSSIICKGSSTMMKMFMILDFVGHYRFSHNHQQQKNSTLLLLPSTGHSISILHQSVFNQPTVLSNRQLIISFASAGAHISTYEFKHKKITIQFFIQSSSGSNT